MEIDSHGSSYTEVQLGILQKAYTDLNDNLKSDTVVTIPGWFLPWYELEIDGANFLADGAFGEVYRAKWLESKVIVKQVKQKHTEMREMFEHEVSVWLGLSHPHAVRLFGACHVGTSVFICEYATNGSLDKYLCTHPISNNVRSWGKMVSFATEGCGVAG
ncbi:Serine/threonine protein kinase [Phytophthora megakarya]|uniref:Serine/threonine protein kinase n=1 Tax=Phytophthora megakarya TaxID=4795 RepID=A0A225UWZ4_9STRA|nr:Serine/threonine protein kinase [Phytophthora megakarya]